MQTMNQSLAQLVVKRQCKMEDAMLKSPDQEELQNLVANGGRPGGASRIAR
jgi:Tfp pilus assembly pilus retraction ATPase PilT